MIRRALLLSLGGSVAIQALNAVTGVLGARALGPHGRGELAAILLWPLALSALGTLGVGEASTYHAARRPSEARTVLATAVGLALLQSTVLVGVGAAIAPLVYPRFGPGATTTAYVFLAAIPLNLLTIYPLAVLSGLGRFGGAQVVRVSVVVGLASGFAGLWLGGALTVRSAALVYLASMAVTTCLAVALALHASTGRLAVSTATARALLGFGVRSHATNVSSLSNERLDQLLISLFLAPAALGLYAVAVTLSSVTALVGASVSLVALPLVAAARPEARAATAARLVAFTLAASAAVSVPIVVFAPQLLRLCFGSAFSGAGDVARILLLGAVVLSTSRVLGAVLQAVNRPLDAGISETAALVVTVAALAALLPTLGLMGAGIASVLAYGTSAAWNLRRAARALDLAPRKLLVPRRAKPLVTALEGS